MILHCFIKPSVKNWLLAKWHHNMSLFPKIPTQCQYIAQWNQRSRVKHLRDTYHVNQETIVLARKYIKLTIFTYLYLYQLSPWSGWTGFLLSKQYVVHWRRYFEIWLREGFQVLPGKTTCLPQISHGRIDRATRGRRLPELTPPGSNRFEFRVFLLLD